MVRLKRLGVLSAAKTAALVYAVFGIVVAIALLGGSLSSSPLALAGFYLLVPIIMPLIYAGVGFISGAFIAWFYNLISRKFDVGLVLELEPVAPNLTVPATL